MSQEKVHNEEFILEHEVTSGKSKSALPILQFIAEEGELGHTELVCSYKFSPAEILDKINQIENIRIFPDGKVGIVDDGKVREIGKYHLLYSKEHFFNAVLVCISGGDVILSTLAHTYIGKMNVDGILVTFVYGGRGGLSFDAPIAQQVYDSEFVDADFHDSDGLTETVQEWFSLTLNSKSDKDKKSGGCYIATAVYGSYDCPEVWTLRRYRDYTLAATWYGRSLIKVYYAISPTLVKWFGQTSWFQKIWRRKVSVKTGRVFCGRARYEIMQPSLTESVGYLEVCHGTTFADNKRSPAGPVMGGTDRRMPRQWKECSCMVQGK